MNQRKKPTYLKSTLLFILASFFVTSCSFGPFRSSESSSLETSKPIVSYSFFVVILDSEGNWIEDHQNVLPGTIIPEPTLERLENSDFLGWYSYGEVHDFTLPLYEGTVIIARFGLDQSKALNTIRATQLKSNVMIHRHSYNQEWYQLNPRDVKSGQGSGVIFAENDHYYYVLTNYHVIALHEGRKHRQFDIFDYKEKKYEAHLYEEVGGKDGDLAVLYFKKGAEKLRKINFARKNTVIGGEVVVIGQPEGKMNTITFGRVTDYGRPEYRDFPFDCMLHTAATYGGSSGGAVLNYLFELTALTVGKEPWGSWAIPITDVAIYLRNYFYS